MISLKGNVNAVDETVSKGSKVGSVLNEVKKPLEKLDTLVRSAGKDSNFSKCITSWGKKAEEVVGEGNIKGIKDTKELVENYKRDYNVGINIMHGMQNPATLNEGAKKSVSDIPIIGELGEDMIDLFENLTEK